MERKVLRFTLEMPISAPLGEMAFADAIGKAEDMINRLNSHFLFVESMEVLSAGKPWTLLDIVSPPVHSDAPDQNRKLTLEVV